ncbi:MAG: hypothetical protein RL095_1563 [Verrucomicrobiota bacterium]|jgi:hypothetical protein
MNTRYLSRIACGLMSFGLVSSIEAVAQDAAAPVRAPDPRTNTNTLGISAIKIAPALERHAKAVSIQRTAEALSTELSDAFAATGKFQVVARDELARVLSEQKLAESGIVDPRDPAAAKSFQIRGVKWLVLSNVSDFSDIVEKANFDSGRSAERRTVRLGGTIQIIDSSSGVLAASIPVRAEMDDTVMNREYSVRDGNNDEELYRLVARDFAKRGVADILDRVMPAKILARPIDGVASISRGQGTNIAIGEVWDVFGLGEQLIDPDTGAVLGSQELKLGKVRIVEIHPLFSKAQIIEDNGMDRGHICRLSLDKPKPVARPAVRVEVRDEDATQPPPPRPASP